MKWDGKSCAGRKSKRLSRSSCVCIGLGEFSNWLLLLGVGVVVSELSSLPVLQNKRKREVDLERVSLAVKDIIKSLCNGFYERYTIVV